MNSGYAVGLVMVGSLPNSVPAATGGRDMADENDFLVSPQRMMLAGMLSELGNVNTPGYQPGMSSLHTLQQGFLLNKMQQQEADRQRARTRPQYKQMGNKLLAIYPDGRVEEAYTAQSEPQYMSGASDIINPQTGEVVYDAPDPQAKYKGVEVIQNPDGTSSQVLMFDDGTQVPINTNYTSPDQTKEQFELYDKSLANYQGEAGGYLEIMDTAERLYASADEVYATEPPPGADQDYHDQRKADLDQSLVVSVLKMGDPTSVARESEVLARARSRGALDNLAAMLPKLEAGETLTANQRRSLLQLVEDVRKEVAGKYGGIADRYQTLHSELGLPEYMSFGLREEFQPPTNMSYWLKGEAPPATISDRVAGEYLED
jgi:hypothetical protein